MKVLLINPPALDLKKHTREGRCTQSSSFWSITYPPLSLAQVAAELTDLVTEQHGLDFSAQRITLEESLIIVNDINADVAIVSLGTPTVIGDLYYCKKLKEVCPSIKIILIGTHSSHFSNEILHDHKQIDFIIHGEPEGPIYTLLSKLKEGLEINQVFPGISYLYKGTLQENKKLVLQKDLDQLKIPRWDLFDLHQYRLPLNGRKFLLISPQRGCPWKCTFCTAPLYSGNAVRSKSIESIIEEITFIKEHYKINDFLFWSDTFTANKKFVEELCLKLKPLNINWVSNSRIDTIDENLAKIMYESGCWILTFGIESFNNKTLLNIKKGFSNKEIVDGFNSVSGSGILTIAHIIAGLPGESTDDFLYTYKNLSKMGFNYIQPYLASPFPGTALFEQVIKEKGNINAYNEFSQERQLVNDRVWQKIYKRIRMKCIFRMKSIVFLVLCAVKSSHIYGFIKNKKNLTFIHKI